MLKFGEGRHPRMSDDTSSCREYTHPRDNAESYPKGAIGNDTKIAPALNLVVTRHHNL